LLTEAGYPTGFKTVLHSDVRRRADELVAIQSYFKEIGIETTLDVADVARATTFVQSTGGWDGILVPGFPNWSSFTETSGAFPFRPPIMISRFRTGCFTMSGRQRKSLKAFSAPSNRAGYGSL